MLIRSIAPLSCAAGAGLRPGDRVVSVDDVRVEDELDFLYATAREYFSIAVIRRGAKRVCEVRRTPGATMGVRFSASAVRRCANRCVFCFVDQMPPGLRKSLYVKDEDYRHSFLHGNYITLTSLNARDRARIAGMRISPLYISVHATDNAVRRRLLGNPRAPAVMPQLRFLQSHGIQFHTQIVVCPGMNDGAILRATIFELLRLRAGLLSIAVVPVGLTRFRKKPLRGVDTQTAATIIDQLLPLHQRMQMSRGKGMVYLADEFFVLSGRPVPPRKYYEDYPQLENGVGLLRSFLEEWRSTRRLLTPSRKKSRITVAILTSQSAERTLGRVIDQAVKRIGCPRVKVVAVRNRFFGTTVTVAGLLTARDALHTIQQMKEQGCAAAVIPRVMFNGRGYTLDGFSLERIKTMAAMPVYTASGIGGIIDILKGMA